MPHDASLRPDSETPAATVARLAAAARELRTPCGDGSMAWRVWGEGEPVVLLHGSFGSWTHWLRNIPVLAGRRMVVAADLPGMGDSAEPPQPFDAASLGAIVARGIAAILPAGERFHLAGFSFGGIVGGQAALRLEPRVRSFTVVGSNALALPFARRPDLMKPRRGMSPAEIREVHRHNLGVMMFGDADRIDDLALHLQTENTRRARIRSGAIPRGDTLRNALSALRVPIHGIWGGRDGTAGPHLDERRALFEALDPPAGFRVIDGAGHWVAYEAADAFNAALEDILSAH